MANDGWAELLLFAGSNLLTGYLAHSAGKQKGYAMGYQQAEWEDSTTIRQLREQLVSSQRETSAWREQAGRLETEKKVLVSALSQQPSSPQVEAILKSVQRMEFRLIEVLPPQLEEGHDGHNSDLN